MMKVAFLLLLFHSCLVAFVHCYEGIGFDPLEKILEIQSSKRQSINHVTENVATEYSPVYVGPQDGLKAPDKIVTLPGQPNGLNFDQYSGYIIVDPNAGRALFYYFAESQNSSSKPLVLWLNGGPGCSSFGNGAFLELGPFRVNSDGKTLSENKYAWNNDYDKSGNARTAADTYTFLVNWLERFPEYKTRDFFISGESYAGHYVPQLAQLILQNNNITNQTVINLRGIAGIVSYCNFTLGATVTKTCQGYRDQANNAQGRIFIYNIYAPLCIPSSSNTVTISAFPLCADNYVVSYLNIPEVQKSIHANVTGLPGLWEPCNNYIGHNWKDSPLTVLPTIQELMASGINVWIYSGDIDGKVSVTTSRYAINKLQTSVRTSWYPWYLQGEVGGYAVGYENLTFVTIRGAGHLVPSYQPARALAFFSSFLEGKLPPPN